MNHKLTFAGRIGFSFLLIAVLQIGCPVLATADMSLYRCNVDGRIEFRQTACESGDQSTLQVVEHSSGMTPAEPGLRLKKPSEKTDTVQKPSKNDASEQQCWRKRQQLEKVERQLRGGYKPSQYQRLHDRQDEYESYLRRFCR